MNKNYFKQSNTHKHGSHSAFALILVLLFTAIVLIVITLISTSLVSGIRLNRQSQNTYEAYNMARDAITDAVTKLRQPTVTGPNLIFPSTNSCLISGDYHFSNGVSPTTYNQTLTSSLPFVANSKFYAYQLCADGNSTGDYIRAIGFSGGQQIVLRAIITLKGYYTVDYSYDVTNASGTTLTTEKCGTDPTFIKQCNVLASYPNASIVLSTQKFTHDKDLIHIYQVGP